jgi:hypothetical protein
MVHFPREDLLSFGSLKRSMSRQDVVENSTQAQVESEPGRGPSAADFRALTADRSILISSACESLSETACESDLARRPRWRCEYQP